MRGTAWLALVGFVAACQEAQAPRQTLEYKPPAVPAGSECYRISTSAVFEVGALPQLLALTHQRAPLAANQGAFRVLPDLNPDLPGRQMPYSEWFPTGEKTVTLFWSNGFYGVTLELRRVGDGLEGVGKTHSDLIGDGPETFTVVGEQASCPA